MREQPAYRVTANSYFFNLPELLVARIGGQRQIEIAEAVLARFGTITHLLQAHIREIIEVKGIDRRTKCVETQTVVRLKSPGRLRPTLDKGAGCLPFFMPCATVCNAGNTAWK